MKSMFFSLLLLQSHSLFANEPPRPPEEDCRPPAGVPCLPPGVVIGKSCPASPENPNPDPSKLKSYCNVEQSLANASLECVSNGDRTSVCQVYPISTNFSLFQYRWQVIDVSRVIFDGYADPNTVLSCERNTWLEVNVEITEINGFQRRALQEYVPCTDGNIQ
jgi:hypothetical protein